MSFTITNATFIPLEDVRPTIGLCRVIFGVPPHSIELAALHKVDPKTGGCRGSLAQTELTAPGRSASRLAGDERYTIALDEFRAMLQQPALHGRPLTYADISILVRYRAFGVPWWKHQAEFRFATHMADDGKLYWLSLPVASPSPETN